MDPVATTLAEAVRTHLALAANRCNGTGLGPASAQALQQLADALGTDSTARHLAAILAIRSEVADVHTEWTVYMPWTRTYDDPCDSRADAETWAEHIRSQLGAERTANMRIVTRQVITMPDGAIVTTPWVEEAP